MTDIQALGDPGSGPIQFEGLVGEGLPGPPGGPLPAASEIDLKPRPNSVIITQALGTMFETGHTIELRIPNAGKLGTVSGYFDDFGKLADAAIRCSAGSQIPGVYVTLNPVLPALLARSANRAKPYAKATTTDENVLCRRWLLVDVDPTRPAGISSTDSEKSAADVVIRAIRDWLTGRGWPEPLVADSGNGFHLLYRIDLQNDETSKTLLKKCLEKLAAKFDNKAAKVDATVFNAARIVKLYGTVAAKGDSTPDRPHRMSRLFKPPEKINVVSTELLDGLAHGALALEPPAQRVSGPQSAPPETGNAHQASVQAEDVEKFLAFYGIAHKSRARFAEGSKWVLEQCFFDSNHKNNEAAILLRDDGVLCYNCFHASCAAYQWKDLRSGLEARDGKKFSFNTRTEFPAASAPLGGNESPSPKPKAGTEPAASLRIQSAASIKPEAISWLWPNRIPFGKKTMLGGDPGQGKSLVSVDVVARYTAKLPWPDDENTSEPGHVLMLVSEDDPADTVVPRLMAAGADLDRVNFLTSTIEEIGKNPKDLTKAERDFALDADMRLLDSYLEGHPETRLVVIDPISNYLGRASLNKEQELRRVLTPLVTMARVYGVAVLVIAHFNKNNVSGIHKIGGAVALVGVARIVWAFVESPDDPDVKLMLPIKANISKRAKGLKYKIEAKPVQVPGESKPLQVPVISWQGDSEATLDGVLTTIADPEESKKRQAENWLSERMSAGPRLAREIFKQAETEHFAEKTVRRAQKALRLKVVQKSDGWWWFTPAQYEEDLGLPKSPAQPEPREPQQAMFASEANGLFGHEADPSEYPD